MSSSPENSPLFLALSSSPAAIGGLSGGTTGLSLISGFGLGVGAAPLRGVSAFASRVGAGLGSGLGAGVGLGAGAGVVAGAGVGLGTGAGAGVGVGSVFANGSTFFFPRLRRRLRLFFFLG